VCTVLRILAWMILALFRGVFQLAGFLRSFSHENFGELERTFVKFPPFPLAPDLFLLGALRKGNFIFPFGCCFSPPLLSPATRLPTRPSNSSPLVFHERPPTALAFSTLPPNVRLPPFTDFAHERDWPFPKVVLFLLSFLS